MEIFGVGPWELVFIFLLALIILGPTEMLKGAQKSASWLRKLRQSELWKSTKEVMDLPNQVMKESGLDKEIHEIQRSTQRTINETAWQPTPIIENRKPMAGSKTGDANTESAVKESMNPDQSEADQGQKNAS